MHLWQSLKLLPLVPVKNKGTVCMWHLEVEYLFPSSHLSSWLKGTKITLALMKLLFTFTAVPFCHKSFCGSWLKWRVNSFECLSKVQAMITALPYTVPQQQAHPGSSSSLFLFSSPSLQPQLWLQVWKCPPKRNHWLIGSVRFIKP